MKCPNCGAVNVEGKKFCGDCGRRLNVSGAGTRQDWKWSLAFGILIIGLWLVFLGATYWFDVDSGVFAELTVIVGVLTIAAATISTILAIAKPR